MVIIPRQILPIVSWSLLSLLRSLSFNDSFALNLPFSLVALRVVLCFFVLWFWSFYHVFWYGFILNLCISALDTCLESKKLLKTIHHNLFNYSLVFIFSTVFFGLLLYVTRPYHSVILLLISLCSYHSALYSGWYL